MPPEEVEALLVEMEPGIRATDRDMREIEILEQRASQQPESSHVSRAQLF